MKNIINICVCTFTIILLYSCAPTRYFYSSGMFGSTPASKKHAKRGYNKPYVIKNRRYYPRKHYEYSQVGMASYYGGTDIFHGRATSTGETFSKHGLTAAHKTLPLPSIARVTNLKNGRSVVVRINDRGPFAKNRIIDVSEYVAKLLGFHHDGVAKVHVECLVKESMLLATRYKPKSCGPRNVHCYNFYNRIFHSVFPRSYSYTSPYIKQPSSRILNAKLRPRRATIKKTYIQTGTFNSTKRAQQLKRVIYQKLRLPSKVDSYTKNRKKYYRVLIGPIKPGYEQRIAAKLKEIKIKDAFIIKK